MAQDGPSWLKIASKMPPTGHKTAPGRLQVATEAPKRQKSFNLKKINVVRLLAFSLSIALPGLKMAPRGPKSVSRRLEVLASMHPRGHTPSETYERLNERSCRRREGPASLQAWQARV